MKTLTRRDTLWIGFLLSLSLLCACPGKGAEKTTTSDGTPPSADAKPPFEVYSTGKPKYDSYFNRVYKLRTDLWRSDRNMSAIPAMIQGVMGLPGDAKKVDLGELFKSIGTKFGNKLLFDAGTGVRVREGSQDPQAAKVAQTLDWTYKTAKGTPESLGGAINESKQLVEQGQALSKSAPNDFKGMEALKLPAVTAKLAESGKELTGVPGQVGKLSGTALSIVKQIPLIFASGGNKTEEKK